MVDTVGMDKIKGTRHRSDTASRSLLFFYRHRIVAVLQGKKKKDP